MGFAEKYLHSLCSTDLRDDQFHHRTDALHAASWANDAARGIGSLLHRVKYSGTITQKLAKALQERERFEKILADAVRRKDEKKADEMRRELEGNLCVCTISGGEADSFRTLSRAWLEIVAEKGAARRWVKPEDIPTIGHLAPAMYKRVADASLAHYLDGKCTDCRGTGITQERAICRPCKGSGDGEITGLSDFERHRAMDMLSELMSLESSHSGAANALLRRDE